MCSNFKLNVWLLLLFISLYYLYCLFTLFTCGFTSETWRTEWYRLLQLGMEEKKMEKVCFFTLDIHIMTQNALLWIVCLFAPLH